MSITEEKVNIKELEKIFFEKALKEAREAFQKALEEYDKKIKETRSKKEYRHKGKRKRTIKTIM